MEDVYFSHCAIALTGDNARQKCPLLLLLHTDCVYGSFSWTIFVFKKSYTKEQCAFIFLFLFFIQTKQTTAILLDQTNRKIPDTLPYIQISTSKGKQ